MSGYLPREGFDYMPIDCRRYLMAEVSRAVCLLHPQTESVINTCTHYSQRVVGLPVTIRGYRVWINWDWLVCEHGPEKALYVTMPSLHIERNMMERRAEDFAERLRKLVWP
jgi:hypothetical protein